jgi:hypothetical protein
MPIQLSTAIRNAMANQIEATIGASAVLRIRSGAAPANCATADSGTVLATCNLPSDWLSAASSGVVSQVGTWQDASADATGTAAHFRLYDSSGTVCGMQGNITVTGGGGDMTVDSTSFTAGQQFTITSFSYTRGNA